MANRVILEPNKLLISKPGVNVLTATNTELLFSSEWSAPGIHMRGSVMLDGAESKTVLFSKAFDTPPFVTLAMDLGDPHARHNIVWGGFAWVTAEFGDPNFPHVFIAAIANTGMSFMSSMDTQSEFYYTVWDYET